MSIVSPVMILQAAERLRQANLTYHTPLESSDGLSTASGAYIYQKLELFQPTGSFKLRGATNKLWALSAQERAKGVVTASAGNHALGVAYAARALGIAATIVVPESASTAKVAALRPYPIKLIQHGANFETAERYARELEREQALTFVSPYNDSEVIAGQGTIALEILAALPDVDVLLVPVGGGGLISGITVYAKAVAPYLKIMGVQSEASPFMHAALAAGKLVDAPDLPSLADGLAGAIEVGSLTFELAQRLVDEIILVSETDIAQAIGYYLNEQHLVVEGSGAVGLAALLSGKFKPKARSKVVNVVSGRNIATNKLLGCL